MGYRYPFTPFPQGWYRINEQNMFAFGKQLELLKNSLGSVNLCERPAKHSFPFVYKNGFLFGFFDEQGHKPYFDVPDVPEFSDPNWQPPFYLSWENTRVHVQEVAENALDLSHFCTVHTYKDIPVLSNFHTFGHQFNVIMHSRRNVLGFISQTTMDITYHGIGIVVAHVTTSSGVILKVLLMSTPIDEEHVDIHMAVSIKKTKNTFKDFIFRRFVPMQVKAEFTRDIPIWETKIYQNKPLLCHNETNIARIRKWAKQFYFAQQTL